MKFDPPINRERKDRPGHTITRKTKGHPRRQARRDRAAERLVQK